MKCGVNKQNTLLLSGLIFTLILLTFFPPPGLAQGQIVAPESSSADVMHVKMGQLMQVYPGLQAQEIERLRTRDTVFLEKITELEEENEKLRAAVKEFESVIINLLLYPNGGLERKAAEAALKEHE